MAKPILPLMALLALAVPAAASADILRADLRGDQGAIVKIDHKGKHRGKGHGKHHRGGHDRYDYDDWDDQRDERRAYRQGYREGRRQAYQREYYRPGYAYQEEYEYRRFSRGQHLPREYRSYVIDDYGRYGYPPPPRGCRYVQVGGNTYLIQIATGLILNAFLGGGY